MSNPAYNIYVRYPDASSDLRWQQIWIDSYNAASPHMYGNEASEAVETARSSVAHVIGADPKTPVRVKNISVLSNCIYSALSN